MFRRPSFSLAEIAWRWSFGLAAAFLSIFAFLEYLNTLPVSRRDLLLLRTGQPALVSQALAHILRGSGPRAVHAMLLIAFAMALAWMMIAALGRAVTTKAVLSYFADRGMSISTERKSWHLTGLVGLNLFRIAAALAATVGFVASWMLAGAVSPDSDPSPGSAFLVFLTMLMLVSLAWAAVNWFLSFASIFTVANGEDTFGAMGVAVDLCRARVGSVVSVSFWFGLAHIVAFVIASSVAAFPLGFAAILPGGVVVGGVLLVTLVYFAVADFLYMGRLAAYLAIAEMPAWPVVPEAPGSNQLSAVSIQPVRAAVDPDELILSDVPSSVET